MIAIIIFLLFFIEYRLSRIYKALAILNSNLVNGLKSRQMSIQKKGGKNE